MRTLHRGVAAGAAVALTLTTLSACGSGTTDEAARAAGMVPSTAVAFASISLDPSVAQKRNLFSVAKKIGGKDVRGDFEESRNDLLDSIVEPLGLDYESDVKPWLGDEVALAVFGDTAGDDGRPEPVVILEVDDEKAADAALTKAEKRAGDGKVTHRFIEGHAVVGSAKGVGLVKADPPGGALADAQRFTSVVDELNGDRLLLVWADGKRAGELLADAAEGFSAPASGFEALGATGSFALDVRAESSAIVLEAVAEGSENLGKARKAAITAGLPEATFAALTLVDLAAAVNRSASQVPADVRSQLVESMGFDPFTDVLPWMGGEAVVVGGNAAGPGQKFPEAALVVEVTDTAAAAAVMPKIVAAIEDRAGLPLDRVEGTGGTRYVTAEPLAEGVAPAMALLGDRFILATNVAYLDRLAKGGGDTLGATDDYKEVFGDEGGEVHFQLLVRAQPILELVRANLTGDDLAGFDREYAPKLESIGALGARAAKDGRFQRFTLKLTID